LAVQNPILHGNLQRLGSPNEALLAKWARIREIRDQVNKDIEALRADGKVGASLQAAVTLQAGPEDHALLASLGQDVKFVFITSQLNLVAGDSLMKVAVSETPNAIAVGITLQTWV